MTHMHNNYRPPSGTTLSFSLVPTFLRSLSLPQVYPGKRLFVETVKAEVQHQARRLTGHASLALWCGSNEAVKGVAQQKDYGMKMAYAADLTVLFDQGVRMALWETSPTAIFYASSPSNDAIVDWPAEALYQHRWLGNPFDPRFGDVRHYDYQSLCTLTDNFPRGRFVSEYGWQSYPSLHTLAPVTSPEDWSNNSTMMNHRQHHPDGNAQLLAQIQNFFHVPTSANSTTDFVDFIYLSQVVQAQCISTQTRFYRALKQEAGAYTCVRGSIAAAVVHCTHGCFGVVAHGCIAIAVLASSAGMAASTGS